MRQRRIQTGVQVVIGIIALFGLLTYNFIHTGSLLASHVDPKHQIVGYIAAASIELSVVALAYQIGRRKTTGANAVFFWVVLIMVVLVSALANASEGFMAKYREAPTVDLIKDIDLFQLIVWLAATALISLIVLSLSEIFGQDLEMMANTDAGKVRCPVCDFTAEWPTPRYETKRSAEAAVRGHRKKHKK